MKVIFKLLVLGSFFTFAYAFAQTTTADPPAKISVVQYPINTTVQPAILLSINIPTGFRALQTLQQLADPNNAIAEFVPQHDNDYRWTQIITGVTMKDTHISADSLVKYMQDKFKEKAAAVKIIDTTNQLHTGYQQACTTMDYAINNRHEIVMMCYYCGPDDCAGAQNAMLWPTGSNMTTEQMTAKLKSFFTGNVNVITVPENPAK